MRGQTVGIVTSDHQMYFWTILTHESTCTRAGLPSHPGKSNWNTDCQMIPKDGGTALSSTQCMCIGHEADDDVGQEDIKNGRTKKDGEIARQTDTETEHQVRQGSRFGEPKCWILPSTVADHHPTLLAISRRVLTRRPYVCGQ